MPGRPTGLNISYLLITLVKLMHEHIFPGSQGRLDDVEAVLVACAVTIGHVENKLMTPHKIALFLGLPRTTVLRKLAILEQYEFVQRRDKNYDLSDRIVDRDRRRWIDGSIKAMKRFSADL
mgnify:CR=1 FL=1